MRIYRKDWYIAKFTLGISGFQRWGEYETVLMRGDRARSHRCDVDHKAERLPPIGQWRLCDGHLPDCQPVTDGLGAMAWIQQEPVTRQAVLID